MLKWAFLLFFCTSLYGGNAKKVDVLNLDSILLVISRVPEIRILYPNFFDDNYYLLQALKKELSAISSTKNSKEILLQKKMLSVKIKELMSIVKNNFASLDFNELKEIIAKTKVYKGYGILLKGEPKWIIYQKNNHFASDFAHTYHIILKDKLKEQENRQ